MDAVFPGRLINPFAYLTLQSPFRPTVADANGDVLTPADTDRVELDRSLNSSLRVVDAEIVDALNQALGESGLNLEFHATNEDLSPQQIAERVLGYVDTLLNQGAPEQRQQLLEQAREAIERGFARAMENLQHFSPGSEGMTALLDESHELIARGLERIAADGGAQTVATGDPHSGSATAVAVQAASYSSRASTSLVIETLDGDRVTVEIARYASASQAAVAAQGSEFAVNAARHSREAGVSFSFGVAGELDEDEMQAIASLLKRVDKASEKFFHGNVQAAFSKVAAYNYDTDALAGFTLDMTRTRSYQAISAYQETAAQDDTLPGLGDVAQLGADLDGVFGEAARRTRLAHPARELGGIFNHLVGERAAGTFRQLEKDAQSLLHGLVEGLVSSHEDTGSAAGHEQDDVEDRVAA